MFRSFVAVVLAVFTYVFVCCERGESYARGIREIDTMLVTNPDSAYGLLLDFDTTLLTTDRDKAMFDLLWAEARDKTLHDDTVAEKISCAAQVFGNFGDSHNQMRALYYKGRILQNAEAYGSAVVTFLDALELADTTENYYIAKIYWALSEVEGRLGDRLQKSKYAKKTWERFQKLDSLIFEQESKLWYASTLTENDRAEEGIALMKEVYEDGISCRDTGLIRESLSSLGNASLWKKDYRSARRFLNKLYDMDKDDMALRDMNFLLWAMVEDHAPADSIKEIAGVITKEYGEDAVYHEYYLLIGDYKKAFESLKKENRELNLRIGQKDVKESHYIIKQHHDEKLSDSQKKLSSTRLLNRLLILSSILTILVAILIFKILSDRKNRRIQDLLDKVGLLSKELANHLKDNEDLKAVNNSNADKVGEKGNTATSLLSTIFIHLDRLYSEYYKSDKKQTGHLLDEMEKNIDKLRSDDRFLEELESEINNATGGLLMDVYDSLQGFSSNQRRLAAYLYLGMSVESICMIFKIHPETFYNRKSRLKSSLSRSTSERKEELPGILFKK